MCHYDQLLLCVNNYRGEDYSKPNSCVECDDCVFNPKNEDLAEDPDDPDKVIKLTKEQMSGLIRQFKKNQTETLYICEICNEKLIGMEQVTKHVETKQHYEYRDPNHPTGRLMIG